MASKGLAVFCLLVTLLQVRAQINCYPNPGCAAGGSQPSDVSSAGDCCLQNLTVTRSYVPTDGSSACQPCIVIGFRTGEMEISENFLEEVDIDVEILTPNPDFTAGVRLGTLSFTVGLNPSSNATFGKDFIFGNFPDSTTSYSSMIKDLPVSVNVKILPDLIPGEEESFVLELADVALTNFTSGKKLDVFVAVNSVTVVIVDDDVLEVNFKDHEFSADESDGKMNISFVISNPIIRTTHFFVVPMTYKDYDDQYSALSAKYPGLDPFTLGDEYDQAEPTDFVQGRLAFSILGNTTELNQNVTITLIDDNLLEPVEEGFRLVLMVDESKTNRSLVSFGRQLALFRIDDRTDNISFGFVNAVQYQDDIIGTHDVNLRVNITHGATEIPFILRFFVDEDRTNATKDVDYLFITTATIEIHPPNTVLPQEGLPVQILGDDVFEGDERVVISFSRPLELQLPLPFESKKIDNPPNSDVTPPPDRNIDVYRESTTIVIREVIPQINVTLTVPEVVREGDTFFPRLTVSHKVNATFAVYSLDGTAERVTDYPFFLEEVEFDFSSFSLSTDSPVSVEMDRLVEPNETFYISVLLSGTSPPQDKVMIINPTVQITIIDTNNATIGIDAPDRVHEYDEQINITVAVEGDRLANNAVIMARLNASSVTPTMGADFEPFEKDLTFTGGIQEIEVSVPFMDDKEPEEDETIDINLEILSSNVKFVPLDRSLFSVEIQDDDEPSEKVCTLSSNLYLQTFSNQQETGHSISIGAGCERKLVTSCDPDVDLEIRVDFFQDNFASTKVAILYNEMLVIIDEDLNLIPPTAPSSAFDYVTDMNMVSVAIPGIKLTITRNRTELTISADNTTLGLVGLCGNLDGQLFYPDCTTPYGMEEALESLMNSYKLKPADQVLRGEREECGITTNDTVIGDPLMTVPIHVPNHLPEFDSGLNLCYEIHGAEDKYFNLVSDGCTSVNAHYARASAETTLNIIDSMSIVAVDNQGKCHNITVDATSGDATVDTNSDITARRAISKRSTVFSVFDEEGISVRSYPSRVRISVPNCEDNTLVMWVIFQNQPLYDPVTNTTTEPVNMIKFEITRGLNLKERSHGLLGQFWNIPITVTPYNGPLVYPEHSQEKFYTVDVKHPSSAARSFVGFIHDVTWEWKRKHCLYVGDQQGGPAGEVRNDGSVIQGSYEDYITDTKYGTEFKYDAFTHVCPPKV